MDNLALDFINIGKNLQVRFAVFEFENQHTKIRQRVVIYLFTLIFNRMSRKKL